MYSTCIYIYVYIYVVHIYWHIDIILHSGIFISLKTPQRRWPALALLVEVGDFSRLPLFVVWWNLVLILTMTKYEFFVSCRSINTQIQLRNFGRRFLFVAVSSFFSEHRILTVYRFLIHLKDNKYSLAPAKTMWQWVNSPSIFMKGTLYSNFHYPLLQPEIRLQ